MPRTILLVEDDESFAEIFALCLEESLWQVTIRGTLQDALDWLTRHRPAVILLDLNLPDSRELATFERMLQASADIPIVVITALTGTHLEGNIVAGGAVWYLDKFWVGAHMEEFLLNLETFVEGVRDVEHG